MMADEGISLRDHFEALRRDDQKAIERAVDALETRLAGMNEFRQALTDQGASMMPRQEADARLNSLSAQLGELRARLDRGEGKGSGLAAGWGYLVGGLGLVAAVVSLVMRFR
jgi:hypothetical protein